MSNLEKKEKPLEIFAAKNGDIIRIRIIYSITRTAAGEILFRGKEEVYKLHYKREFEMAIDGLGAHVGKTVHLVMELLAINPGKWLDCKKLELIEKK